MSKIWSQFLPAVAFVSSEMKQLELASISPLIVIRSTTILSNHSQKQDWSQSCS